MDGTRAYAFFRLTRSVFIFAGTLLLLNASAAMATVSKDGNTFYFSYTTNGHTVRYAYAPGAVSPDSTGTLRELNAEVDGAYRVWPAYVGGPRVELAGGTYSSMDSTPLKAVVGAPAINDNGTPGDASDDYVEATFHWTAGGDDVVFTYRLSLDGPTLVVELLSPQGKIVDWSIENSQTQAMSGPAPTAIPYIIPYMPYGISILPDSVSPAFMASTFDASVSESTKIEPAYEGVSGTTIYMYQYARYEKDTAGLRRPSHERLRITVSPQVEDMFQPLPSWTRISPYRNDMKPRVIYDNWINAQFGDTTAKDLQRLYRHGLRDIFMIVHSWQRYGYDVKLPDHVPPAPGLGGEAGMRTLLSTSTSLGYRTALHENYTDQYPDAPSYAPSRNALNGDGSYTAAWFNTSTGVQSYLLRPTSALEAMQLNAPSIASYGVTGGFVDVVSSMNFGAKADHNAAIEGASRGRTMIDKYIALMDYARTTYGGPFLGEGGWSTLWAGTADAVEPALTLLVSWDLNPWCQFPPIVDYDLLRVHPRMVNHGPGYHVRYFGGSTLDANRFDTARAHTVAFGRAGFIDTTVDRQQLNLLEAFREYYTMRPVQEMTTLATATEVRYEKNGQYRGLSQALLENDAWRVRVTYDSGVTVWVNAGATPWTVSPGNGQSYDLVARNGWLAYSTGPNGLLAYSTRTAGGSRIDYSSGPSIHYRYVGAPENAGACASVNATPGTHDLHSVAALSIAPDGVPLLQTTARGSSNLTWRPDGSALFRFSDSTSTSTSVVYSDAPPAWRRTGGTLRSALISVWRVQTTGDPLAAVPWSTAAGGQAISWAADRDVDYVLSGPVVADSDEDGISDNDETRDLDPNLPGVQNPFNPLLADSTGNNGAIGPDGIPDGQNDWDEDGISNQGELAQGYNPLDPNSHPTSSLENLTAPGLALLWGTVMLFAVAQMRRRTLRLGANGKNRPKIHSDF